MKSHVETVRSIRNSLMITPKKKDHWSTAVGRWSDVITEAYEMSFLVKFIFSVK